MGIMILASCLEHSKNAAYVEIVMAAHSSLEGAPAILQNLSKLLPDIEALYKDIHAHPELSMQELEQRASRPRGLRKLGMR